MRFYTLNPKLSPKSRFIDAASCFYLLILGLWNARKHHGDSWTKWFLPITTIRNPAILCTQSTCLAMFAPAGDPVLPRSSVRGCRRCIMRRSSNAPYRGTPSLMNGILGAQLLHTKQLRQEPPRREITSEGCLSKQEALI